MNTRKAREARFVRRTAAFVFMAAVSSQAGLAQGALPTSDALTALIRQADQTYAQIKNESIQVYFNRIPINAAIVMGLAMHGQNLLLDQGPQWRQAYEALRLEAHEFLGGLARVHNFINPYDGRPMDAALLARIFDSNASGRQNAWAVQSGFPDPGAVRLPLVLDLVSPESLGRLHLQSDGDRIRLLDEPVNDPVRDSNRPRDTLRENRAEPRKQPIAPGAILGAWQRTTSCSVDAVSPQGDSSIDFRSGGGRVLYAGFAGGGGDSDTFKVLSEQQVDPYTIRYTAVWDSPNSPVRNLVHGKTITITVFRGRSNQLLLCRGGAGGVMSVGYLKINQ